MSVEIASVGVVSSVGLSSATTAAAVRAEINRFKASAVMARNFEPIKMALVAHGDLPPLVPELAAAASMTSRQIRMLRLGAMALRECVAGAPHMNQVPLMLAGPEAYPPNRPAAVGLAFLDRLAKQAQATFDMPRSRVFPLGRAGVFAALQRAFDGLQAGHYQAVVVGGVDTYLDLYLLGTLDMEERILRSRVLDGFIPGEGAGFLLLTREGGAGRMGRSVIAKVDGVMAADEPGHRYEKKVPYRGEGLDAAFRGVFAAAPGDPIATVYAGFNGENFNAKEWGVAFMRHKARFIEEHAMEHPADCVGDAGAALGAMMLALAAKALEKGQKKSRCLVWGSSDMATRGAAILRKA